MTPREFQKEVARVSAEHRASCEGTLVEYMHLDAKCWYSWVYRCNTCGLMVTTVKPRKPSADQDSYNIVVT